MTTRPDDRGLEPKRGGGRPRQSMMEAIIKSVLRSVASSLGRAITRALIGRR